MKFDLSKTCFHKFSEFPDGKSQYYFDNNVVVLDWLPKYDKRKIHKIMYFSNTYNS